MASLKYIQMDRLLEIASSYVTRYFHLSILFYQLTNVNIIHMLLLLARKSE